MLRLRLILGLTAALLLFAHATLAWEAVRRPSAAGPLYPEKPEALTNCLLRLSQDAPKCPEGQRMVACVVPHSAYGLSGKVAAAAFAQLEPGAYKRVVVLGAPTVTTFQGCSIPAVEAYQTPLGYVPLDRKAIDLLTRSNLFTERGLRYRQSDSHPPLHEIEPAIELVLPFLQERLGRFLLVPIMVGDLRTGAGDAVDAETGAMASDMRNNEKRINEQAFESVARALGAILDENTLVVTTAEFTHFGTEFNFTPFADNTAEQIKKLDDALIACVLQRNSAGLNACLETTKNPITGANALRVLLKILSPDLRGNLLAYDTSGNLLKRTEQSVSYAALGFYMPAPAETAAVPAEPQPAPQPAATAQPETALAQPEPVPEKQETSEPAAKKKSARKEKP